MLNDPTPPTATIAGLLAESGTGFDNNLQDFDGLNAALSLAGLSNVLYDDTLDFTLFAPTDAAFVRLAQSFGYAGHDEAGAVGAIVQTLTALSPDGDPVPLLTEVLTYHVTDTALTRHEIARSDEIATLAGESFRPFGVQLIDQDPTAADPIILSHRADLEATNGYIQAINRVLLPADLGEPVPSQPALPTVGELVAGAGGSFDEDGRDLDILAAAVDAAGLTGALSDHAASLTLLAPTDDAFIHLAEAFGFSGGSEADALQTIVGALTSLAPDGDPIPLLTNILTYHVIGGTQSIQQQLDAQGTVRALNNGEIVFDGNHIIDAEPDADTSFVHGGTNVLAANGAIQTIDGVLLPLDLGYIM